MSANWWHPCLGQRPVGPRGQGQFPGALQRHLHQGQAGLRLPSHPLLPKPPGAGFPAEPQELSLSSSWEH